jgi:cytochrome c553
MVTWRQIMKLISWRVAVRTSVIALVFAASSGYAEDKPSVAGGDLQAKMDYCKTCHGLSGQGYRGAFPMPRLAGQQPEYIENQLKAFTEKRRTNPVMFNVAHALSPAMLAALTTQFKELNPKPLGGAPRDRTDAGRKIYEEGVPRTDIPACTSCHGADAKGNGPFPRLAGQLHDYILRKLQNWDKERGQDPANPDTSAIMEPIAHGLNASQIAAVAAYLSYLE